jgi:hypothetical protein
MRYLTPALLFCLLLLSIYPPGFALAQFPARGFSSILNVDEASQRLDRFRNIFFPKQEEMLRHRAYIYRFDFIHYQKNQPGVVHHGLISGPSLHSPLLRIDLLADQAGIDRLASFLLIRDRVQPQVWKWGNSSHEVHAVPAKNWLIPWIEGINHSPFDILMPFTNWPVEYQKSGRVCGRPAHLFTYSLPQKNNPYLSVLSSVRLALDDAYDAPLRIEHMDGGVLPARTFSLQSFKKVGGQWIVKGIDAKERDSQSRTRYEILAFAHDLDLPENAFQKEGLAQPLVFSSVRLDPI